MFWGYPCTGIFLGGGTSKYFDVKFSSIQRIAFRVRGSMGYQRYPCTRPMCRRSPSCGRWGPASAPPSSPATPTCPPGRCVVRCELAWSQLACCYSGPEALWPSKAGYSLTRSRQLRRNILDKIEYPFFYHLQMEMCERVR